MQKMATVRIGRFTVPSPSSLSGSVAGRGPRSSSAISGIGRRAWSEIRSSRAMITQFATSDEPPYDRNGVVRPVSGISRVTPPMTTKTCSANTPPRPVATSLPKPSREISATRSARSQIRP